MAEPGTDGHDKLYSPDWFRAQQSTATQSADIVVPMLIDLVRPRSVVDVGCGVGAWLAVFCQHGVSTVAGVDGDYVDRAQLQIPQDAFRARDLAKPISMDQTYDLAVCLEVAEHLPPASSATLVESLTNLAPVVLFSAAIPGQGGTGHINCAWPDYWAGLFRARGYVPVDCLRKKLWLADNVWWWYSQNAFVLVRESKLGDYPDLQRRYAADPTDPMRLVHPKLFGSLVYCTDPQTAPLGTTWRLFRKAAAAAARRRMARLSGGRGNTRGGTP